MVSEGGVFHRFYNTSLFYQDNIDFPFSKCLLNLLLVRMIPGLVCQV